jgi:hypothetical protein
LFRAISQSIRKAKYHPEYVTAWIEEHAKIGHNDVSDSSTSELLDQRLKNIRDLITTHPDLEQLAIELMEKSRLSLIEKVTESNE